MIRLKNRNLAKFLKITLLYKIGDGNMIKQMAWNTFKNTGDINTFLELVEVENLEKNMIKAEEQNGNIKDEGNSNSGKQYERL